jgi:hypothetical protein
VKKSNHTKPENGKPWQLILAIIIAIVIIVMWAVWWYFEARIKAIQ